MIDRAAFDAIAKEGLMVVHSVGDTGDESGRQVDFVAGMMTAD